MDFRIGVIWAIVIIVLGVCYEKIWRRKRCEKCITVYVEKLGGEVTSIESISDKEEIYFVRYKRLEQERKATIKFNFFYDMTIQ